MATDNSWVGRVLEAFACALDTEEVRHVGVSYNMVWDRMRAESGSEEARQIWDAVQEAEHEGLWRHSERDWDHVLLTPAGWKRLPGGMPGHEKDGPFLTALVTAWNDPAAPRWRGHILASSLYSRLGWRLNVSEMVNIARRLQDEGMVKSQEMDYDVLLRPTARTLPSDDSRRVPSS